MDKPLKVVFWRGWHIFSKMREPGYWMVWEHAARNAEERGNQLVIFEVPINGVANTVTDIEVMLQEKFRQ